MDGRVIYPGCAGSFGAALDVYQVQFKKAWNYKMKTYLSICFVIIAILFTSAFCLAGQEKKHICFKIIDADRDGKVTFQEFEQFFDDAKDKFASIDLNGDGILSHDEYHQSLGHGAKRKSKK